MKCGHEPNGIQMTLDGREINVCTICNCYNAILEENKNNIDLLCSVGNLVDVIINKIGEEKFMNIWNESNNKVQQKNKKEMHDLFMKIFS